MVDRRSISSRFTCPEITVLFTGSLQAVLFFFFFLLSQGERRAFSQFCLGVLGQKPLFLRRSAIEKRAARHEPAKRTAMLEHVNRL